MPVPSPQPAPPITVLLRRAREGDTGAREAVFTRIYDELRAMAAGHVAAGRRDSLLQPTALVNAACQRLLERQALDAQDRAHLFFILGRAMHDVFVEHIRRENAGKRGGKHAHVTLVELAADDATTAQVDLEEVRVAIEDLRKISRESAEVIMLRFFAGATLQEAADAMGCSFAVARRHWDYAKAWLHDRLSRGDGQAHGPGPAA